MPIVAFTVRARRAAGPVTGWRQEVPTHDRTKRNRSKTTKHRRQAGTIDKTVSGDRDLILRARVGPPQTQSGREHLRRPLATVHVRYVATSGLGDGGGAVAVHQQTP